MTPIEEQEKRCPICNHSVDELHVEMDCCPLDALDDEDGVTARDVLRAFVEWFDGRFPKHGPNVPGFTLWKIAEDARTLIQGQADKGGSTDATG